MEPQQLEQEGLEVLGQMQRPIPGQSLTNSPDNPYPWEQPTEFTEIQPAIESMFINLTEDDAYGALVDIIDSGNTIAEAAQIILFAGFEEGLWNPDLMTLLIEPTMYLIMALVERAGRVEYKIDRDPDELDEEDKAEQITAMEKLLSQAAVQAEEDKVSGVKSGVLPTEIEKKLKEIKVPESLLAPKNTEEV
jgi:hypothetical protein|tara:strand:+ start:197 stop:772 length:576 start_codon:yes stop_codon:yes gene_type:complete